jgi:hypothetical protein
MWDSKLKEVVLDIAFNHLKSLKHLSTTFYGDASRVGHCLKELEFALNTYKKILTGMREEQEFIVGVRKIEASERDFKVKAQNILEARKKAKEMACFEDAFFDDTRNYDSWYKTLDVKDANGEVIEKE